MIDVISGDEPPIELGDESPRNFGMPHPILFLSTVVVQLIVLVFLGASKLHAMPPAKIVKVEALTGYVSHDKFRGNYINDVIFNADAASLLADKSAKNIVLIFKTDQIDSALDTSIEKWKFVRIASDSNNEMLASNEVALKATVSPSRFQAGKQMISVHTSPFFVAEDTANSLGLRDFSRSPVEFEIAVDKENNASIVSADTSSWSRYKPN